LNIKLDIVTTVIITNYKQKKYIEEAIQSVKKQTYKDWELIIIDDTNGEDDLNDFNSPLNHVHVFETDDLGLSGARMFGANFADGEFLLFLDADDKLHPEFLEKTTKVLKENPDIAIAYTDTQHFGEADTSWTQPEYNFYELLSNNFICSCSLIRKSSFDDVGGYDTNNFNYWEDYELWINLGSKGYYGKHIPEKLFYYRIHKESGMQSERNRILAPFYKSYIVSKFPNLYPRPWATQVLNIINQYPPDFISWKPYQQEKFLKEGGLIS